MGKRKRRNFSAEEKVKLIRFFLYCLTFSQKNQDRDKAYPLVISSIFLQ